MIYSDLIKKFSLFILVIAFIVFIYYTIQAVQIVSKTQTSTSDGIYTSYVSTSEEIQDLARELTKKCTTKLCQVQELLNYSSFIPYKTHTFQRNSPQTTIKKNYGDCDDKSNLIISMLHALDIEAYFVLVPKHIFVIVPLNDRSIRDKKGLWINDRKYYILESTSKGSSVGYPLKYEIEDIDVIIDPFSNEKIKVNKIAYKV